MQSLQNQEDYNLKDPKRGEKNQEKEKINTFFLLCNKQDLNRTEFQLTFPSNGVDCVFLKMAVVQMKIE